MVLAFHKSGSVLRSEIKLCLALLDVWRYLPHTRVIFRWSREVMRNYFGGLVMSKSAINGECALSRLEMS
jgi:hypothetical protein